MLSVRAIGLLVYIATRESNISADSLQNYFKEGRDAISTALKELRAEQYIRTKRGKAGNHFYTQTLITDEGMRYLESFLRVQVVAKVISVPVIEYVNTQVEVKRGAKKLNSLLNTGLDPNSPEYRIKSQEIYETEQLKKHSTRIKNRSMKAKENWTASDSGYEFEARISNIWAIPPWSVTNSRFIPALATARKKHGTNGQIECTMMDLFLIDDGWLKHQTGDRLWQGFIRRFSELAKTAKMLQPSEMTEEKRRQIEKSWEGL